MIKITGLYKSKTKNGEVYLSGKSLDGTKYYVFKNKKKKDKYPDYNLFMKVPIITTSVTTANVNESFDEEVNDDVPF